MVDAPSRDPRMVARLLGLLRCPRCKAPLGEVPPTPAADGSAGGLLEPDWSVVCSHGHRFAAEHGYLDLSEPRDSSVEPAETTRRTFESFGYEWNTFDDVREEDSEFAEVYFRDLDLSSLEGLVGLDAGCGKGRYTRWFAEHLDGIVALDGSSAVEAAARNLAPYPNLMVVKADLRSAPVAEQSFGFVSCLGVLHHLEHPRAGFEELCSLLEPGGRMLLYLYSRPSGLGPRSLALWFARQMRRVTVRLPHPLLRSLCTPVAAGLYLGVVVPGAAGQRRGVRALASLPMSAYRGKPFRSLALDTFDRLSAPVEHRFVWSEIEPWFTANGMEVLAAREETGWFVLCRKPPDRETPR